MQNESVDYKRGWYDGYQAAMRNMGQLMNPAPWHNVNSTAVCQRCGIMFDEAMGYVCGHTDCPSNVKCATTGDKS